MDIEELCNRAVAICDIHLPPKGWDVESTRYIPNVHWFDMVRETDTTKITYAEVSGLWNGPLLSQKQFAIANCLELQGTYYFDDIISETERLLHHHKHNEIGFIPRAKIQTQADNGNLYFIFHLGRIVGFFDVYCRDDKIMKWIHVMVEFDYRQHGLGRNAFETVLERAKTDDMNRVVIITRVDNQSMQLFLMKLGFKRCLMEERLFKRSPLEYVSFQYRLKGDVARGKGIFNHKKD